MRNSVYLDTFTIEEAYEKLEKASDLSALSKQEWVHVSEALGRVTAKAVFANVSNPHYNASAMDGIAVKSEMLVDTDERNPIELIKDKDFIVVDTGDVLPLGFDSVVMVEDVFLKGPDTVEVSSPTYPYEHVRIVGEDIVVGEMLLTTNHVIRPVDLGALISGGVERLLVFAKPRVGLIPTGTEIVVPGTPLKPGDILDSNSYVFSAMVTEAGGEPKAYGPIPDEEPLLRAALRQAVAENDLVVINAGSSAGREDFTAGLIEEMGTLLVHGLSIKPGRPTILGLIEGKPVIGVPGYPVSAYVVFQAFVDPLIRRLSRQQPVQSKRAHVQLTKRIVSSLKHEEYVRMKLGRVGDKLVGTPLNRGAGTTMSLVKADGMLTIPRTSEGYEAGDSVVVDLWQPIEKLNQTLVVIGSHDVLIDYMADALICKGSQLFISSAHVGSLGGIMAIKRREAHIAPIHLLDHETGTYNSVAIQTYLKGQKIVMLKGIKRTQGLYVPKGNPQGINSLRDVAQNKRVFANRQKGSGTRVLLDYILKTEAIPASQIKGYEQELLTHTSVALSVLSGNADTGLGIESVATLMGLDFIPIGQEDYDFIMPAGSLEDPVVIPFMDYLQSASFKELLSQLGGYSFSAFQIIELGGD